MIVRLAALVLVTFGLSRPGAPWQGWWPLWHALAVFFVLKLAGDTLCGRLLPREDRFAEDIGREAFATALLAGATALASLAAERLWGVRVDPAWPALAANLVLFGLTPV